MGKALKPYATKKKNRFLKGLQTNKIKSKNLTNKIRFGKNKLRVESSISVEILSDQKPFRCEICNKSFTTKRVKIK